MRILDVTAAGEAAGGPVAGGGGGSALVGGSTRVDVPGSSGSASSRDPGTPAPDPPGTTLTALGAAGFGVSGTGVAATGADRSAVTSPGVAGFGVSDLDAARSGAAGSTVLARLAGAAFDPGRPGVRALAAVAAVVVAGAAALAWWSRPRVEPVPPSPVVTVAPAATPSAPAEIVVAVTGLVHRPGLVRLAPGARVADAVDAAGGALPEADLSQLNLARRLADGELVAVGVPPPPDEVGGRAGAPAKVNLNTATQTDLETLPGIGPALAQRILAWREVNGGFSSVDQLREISGIGEVRFAELRELVTV